jgi:hypothetical protein
MININIKSMYRTLLIFLIVFQCFSNVFVAQKSQYFPNLKRVSVDADLGVFFNYDAKTTRLINKPCFELDKTDQRFCTKDSVYLEWIVVAKHKSKELDEKTLNNMKLPEIKKIAEKNKITITKKVNGQQKPKNKNELVTEIINKLAEKKL